MAQQKGSHPLTTVAVLLAVLLVAGGGTAAAVILTSDGDDDNGVGGGSEPTTVAIVDWCEAVGELEDDDEEFEEDPSLAAELLREAGVPDDMPEEALRGRDLIIEIAEDAPDGAAAEATFDDLGEADVADANAFFVYYTENCEDDGEPAAPPVSSSTERPTD